MNGFFSQEQLIQDVQECQLHLMMTLFANSSSTRWHQKEQSYLEEKIPIRLNIGIILRYVTKNVALSRTNKDTTIKQTQTFECHSISIQRTPEKTTCYFNEAGSGPGWCGTCYEGNLRPGQEGYCDYYHGTICNISYQVM